MASTHHADMFRVLACAIQPLSFDTRRGLASLHLLSMIPSTFSHSEDHAICRSSPPLPQGRKPLTQCGKTLARVKTPCAQSHDLVPAEWENARCRYPRLSWRFCSLEEQPPRSLRLQGAAKIKFPSWLSGQAKGTCPALDNYLGR
jgi:hypothetical protein